MSRLERRNWGLLALLITCLTSLSLAKNTDKEPQKAVSAPPSQSPAVSIQNDYVTSATCASCHEDLAKKFARNPHQILETHRGEGWQERSCESCHGPGQLHVEAGDGSQIVAFGRLSTREVNANCLSCHARMESHAGGPASLHGKNQIACSDCHRIHDAKQALRLLADRSDQLCIACHTETQAAFSKPFRHRLNEGAIHCIDCHEPHGGLNPRQMKVANGNETACFKCHTDKRGPFAFEHPPMRLEGCLGCHEPHGSINPKMLVRHQQGFLCLECHSAASGILSGQPPSFHDLRSTRFQNCSTCHLKVHGSNVNRFLLR